ncbi:hypothetical protein HO133_008720 [Letharia lupina]|uniref:Eisosome protein 1 n=1 Tax=Letharia lupina TaxID=560253 RepID=A0A8H6CPJ5_9LECA|nr:uncharacterized protein HO133_008720 [Letharia lupina]KAF6227277.1 hypothetical protein HO133_008720 [Letharia lupina]
MTSAKSQKLEDQAATAALYVTKGKDNKSQTKPSNYPLDEHNKLSAASAATSLKHADPKDLPAFPVVGLAHPESSAGAAASLANKDHKSFEYWKPGDIPAANKAAMLAKDYKAAPLWHPELSAAGSKAALLAQREGGDVKIWRPSPTDAGNSAAGQAMRMKGLSPQLDYGHTEEGGRRAMMAATQSMASGRKRAGSTPIEPSLYPDSKNSATNALKAATSVSRAAGRSQPAPRAPAGSTINAAKIHNAAITNLSREMYTSHPPVAPEVEEKNRQAGLRAAAISMAKQMYDVQQKAIEAAAETRRSDSSYAATSVHNRPASATPEEPHNPPQYANLQEAAQKLAAERLAKLHDEHAAYRTYYGTQAAPQTHKLSIRGRARRRASSDGQADDEERSQQIRSEMSLFTDKLAQVDAKKRQKDRDSLLAAAQRNVRASMHGMDEKVFNDTGKVSPAMMEDWEEKAKAKAKAESSARMVNHGKVNIGGGRYMDQSEIDAIAAARVQPTLDEVTATAEKHRARDEELRQQQLERERLAAEKNQDQKERDAKTKEDWRRFKEEEKREARARKEEERAKKSEERRLREAEKQEKRRVKETKVVSEVPVVVANEEPKEEAEEADSEAVVAGPEPPVLDPIPATTPFATDDSKPETLPSDEERIDPTFLPTSELELVNASQANLAPASTEESELEPVYTADSGGHLGGNAEEIARRVFSAPVEGEPTTSTSLGNTNTGTEELVENTSNAKTAPVVGAETAMAPAIETEPTPTVTEPSTTTKHEAPVAARVVPTIPAATTETTVSGPSTSKSMKDKDTGKVSSWLKTKFSRRASKPAKPESTTAPSEGKGKGFVGGANLTGPDASNTSSDRGDSSMREVALAGKDPTATTTEAPLVSPTANDDLYSASTRSLHTGPTAAGALQRESLSSASISSLSSDEDTRGRSAIPREREPITQSQFVHEEIDKGHIDPALTRHTKESESSTGGGEEFEEARDTFDTEKLNPPAAGVLGGTARKSDSPARDSKFMEDL